MSIKQELNQIAAKQLELKRARQLEDVKNQLPLIFAKLKHVAELGGFSTAYSFSSGELSLLARDLPELQELKPIANGRELLLSWN